MRQLGQLEAAIMERLWSLGRPAAVRQVLEDLQRDRTIAYTTVMTVMDKLHRKGLLSREVDGRAYRYSPTRTREQHNAELMGQVLAGSSDRAAALLHFLEQMPPEEVARVRDALTERAPRGKETPR